jgi:Fe-S cluster assembly iron-binding protein IscA
MKKITQLLVIYFAITAFASCSKKDAATVSAAQIQVGQAVTSTTLTGSIKGTLSAGLTYTVNSDITVNAGDTLLIQKGVTLKINNGSNIIVKGTFVSLGTQAAPVIITDPRRVKTTGSSTASTDSAYVGGWGGIYCAPTANLVVIKWTHLDFGGAGLQTIPFTGPSVGNQYVMYFGNPNGVFVFEDSWIYGSPDDAVRFYGGKINFMRNTLEKCGGTGGDGFNAKGGTQGNMAYNLIIGGATNGTKSSNDGGIQPQCMIAMYNNTYVNDGFRNTGTFGARSGSIEVENNSRALAYNNLIVNCAFGVRIAGGNNVTAKVYLADTTLNHTGDPIAQTSYGYNYFYADDVALANQFVPTNIAQAVVTHPTDNGIPQLATFLGASYIFGQQYDGTSLVGKNNPNFVNYPLPNKNYATQASVDAYDFHLAANSPAIGKGTTAFNPINNVPIDANFGSSGITGPGKDIGCYQMDGTGNKH